MHNLFLAWLIYKFIAIKAIILNSCLGLGLIKYLKASLFHSFMKILCVCLKGENRSSYLSYYLKRKGYDTEFGGVHDEAKKRITQADIDAAEVIVVAREYLRKMLEEKFNVKNKKIITLEVSDSPPELGAEAVKINERSKIEFQNRYVRPKLRSQLKKLMPKL